MWANLRDIVPFLTAFAFVVGALAVGWITIRIKSEDSWRLIAERRKVRAADLEEEAKRLNERLCSADEECERVTRRNARLLADLDWYERRYGPIKPDENIIGRG